MARRKKTFEFPDKIRITKDISYKVLFTSKMKEGILGECCPENMVITLRKGMSRRRSLEVLVHEVFHALEFSNRFFIPHGITDQIDKPIVRLLILNGWIN